MRVTERDDEPGATKAEGPVLHLGVVWEALAVEEVAHEFAGRDTLVRNMNGTHHVVILVANLLAVAAKAVAIGHC